MEPKEIRTEKGQTLLEKSLSDKMESRKADLGYKSTSEYLHDLVVEDTKDTLKACQFCHYKTDKDGNRLPIKWDRSMQGYSHAVCDVCSNNIRLLELSGMDEIEAHDRHLDNTEGDRK